MIKFALILMFISGCSVIYLTQKHQNWLKKPLDKKPWRYIGYLTLLFSLYGFLSIYSTGAAVFVWFSLLMFIFATLPFLTLIKLNRLQN